MQCLYSVDFDKNVLFAMFMLVFRHTMNTYEIRHRNRENNTEYVGRKFTHINDRAARQSFNRWHPEIGINRYSALYRVAKNGRRVFVTDTA